MYEYSSPPLKKSGVGTGDVRIVRIDNYDLVNRKIQNILTNRATVNRSRTKNHEEFLGSLECKSESHEERVRYVRQNFAFRQRVLQLFPRNDLLFLQNFHRIYSFRILFLHHENSAKWSFAHGFYDIKVILGHLGMIYNNLVKIPTAKNRAGRSYVVVCNYLHWDRNQRRPNLFNFSFHALIEKSECILFVVLVHFFSFVIARRPGRGDIIFSTYEW